MPLIHTVLRNYSRYPRDVVWENAQDLEHVNFLHRNTNADFRLIAVTRDKESPYEYDSMVYEATRKVKFFRLRAFGFRRIVRDYNIHQIEHLPVLGVRSALNSLLLESGDPAKPTLMMDEVVMEVPRALSWLKGYILRSLARHAATQCEEDEPFRERRVQLREHGINLPFRLFSEPLESVLTRHFTQDLNGARAAEAIPTP
jgi:hypothetical protein